MSISADCLFDSIVAGTAPVHLVAEEAELIGFLDIRPVFPGHTLIVPRRHWSTVSDVPPGVLGALFETGKRVAAAQRKALGAEGTFFGLNDVISQSVPHVHLHVIPRRKGDKLRGFFWPRVKYGDDEEAAAIAASLRDAMEQGPQS